MLCAQADLSVDKMLVFAASAIESDKEAREASTPGGRFCSALTPGVSQTPKRVDAEADVCDSCNLSCCALTSAEMEELKTVASAATETACTTKRVLFNNDEPRGKLFSGTLLNAATKEVWRVRPTASPRKASRKMRYEMGVVASSFVSCQVLMHRRRKPTTRFMRGPILS